MAAPFKRQKRLLPEPEKGAVMSDVSWDRPGTTLAYLGNRVEAMRRGLEQLRTDEARGGMPRRKIKARVEKLRTSTELIRDQTIAFARNRGVAGDLESAYKRVDENAKRLRGKSRRKARNYWLRKSVVAAEEWLEEWRMLTDVEPAQPSLTEELWLDIVEEHVGKRKAAAHRDEKLEAFDDALDDLDDEEDDEEAEDDSEAS